jgi:8-oxo-dGTP diphosphatase
MLKIMNTTLCYIEKDDCYLMLLRNKKKADPNQNKWIGVGGKFEEGESPEECLLREVYEETGLTLLDYRLRGIVTFVSDEWGSEYMFLYTADRFEGEITDCSEGELHWIPKKEVPSLNLWEGDRKFLKLLSEDSPLFSMKLCYHGDELVESRVVM